MKDIAKYFLIILGVAVLCLVLWYFKSIVAYILVAAILSLIGQPIVALFDKIKFRKFTFPRVLSAALILLLLWSVFLLLLRLFVPLIATEAKEISAIDTKMLVQSLDDPMKKIESFIGGLHLADNASFSMKDYFSERIVSVLSVSKVSGVLGFFTRILGNFFVALFAISFISFFFLKDDTLFLNSLVILLPAKYEAQVRRAMDSIKKLLMRYFIGITIDVVIIIILITTGLTIAGLGFNHALVIGLIAGILNVIPYVGPVIAALFGISICIVSNLSLDFYSELLPKIGWVAVVFVIVQVIDGLLFQPLIYSSSVKAHPLEIFLVILIAGSIAGIIGMLVAIPVYTILRVIAKEFFIHLKVVQRLTGHI